MWSKMLLSGSVLLAPLFLACGGGDKPPEVPPPTPEREEASDPTWDTGERTSSRPAEDEKATPKPRDDERKEPEFTPGMSVNDAITAVPSNWDFVGIDQEVLAKPLLDPETFKECKLGTQKFSVRIAVWDGKVVGADVTAKSKPLAECIDRVVRTLEYKEREKSINTVEYSH